MNKIVAKRGRAKGCITLAETFSKSIDSNTTLANLEFRLKKLDEAWQDFVTLQNELLDFIDTEGFVDREPEFAEYEAKYFETRSSISDAILSKKPSGEPKRVSYPPVASVSEISDIATPARSVKLPHLTIHPFSGDYKDWPAFRDMFTGTIDSNPNLTCTDKLRFLQSFLRGNAKDLVKHIACTENNYVEVWDRLEKRYDQKHLIAQSFIQSFLSLPSCTTANLQSLRKIADGADEAIRGLNALDINNRDPWLIYLLLHKLDHETKRAWSEEVGSRDDCMINEFLDFLQTRCRCLESCMSLTRSIQNRPVHTHLAESSSGCPKCKADHSLSHCQDFKTLAIVSRREFVKNKSLCFNCLRHGHASNQCRSTFRCRKCNARHHTLVHSPQNLNSNAILEPSPDNIEFATPVVTTHAVKSSRRFTAILPTAIAQIQDKQGTIQHVRILLDSGSQASFITEKTVQRLGLPRKRSRIPILGIATASAGVTNGLVTLQLTSCYSSDSVEINCFVLPNITSSLPPLSIDTIPKPLLSLELADPCYNQPGPIDILVGADTVFNIIKGAARSNIQGNLVSIPTIFGWVISGRHYHPDIVRTYCTRLDHGQEFDLERFWKIEEICNEPPLSIEEQLAEEHFAKNHIRLPDGRYEVQLPFKPSSQLNFGDSFSTALMRFQSVERKLISNTELKSQYSAFLREYLSLGHMEEIPPNQIFQTNNSSNYYLPHHAVFKGDSSTTKVRIVFDASAKTNTSMSLNETLLIGPSIQRDIFSICLRSRRHIYLMTGDVEKMYRQIWVSRHHTDYQRIIWRETPEQPLKHYRLLTVTYGTSAAPFLAVRTLKQLAIDSANTHPRASAILLNDFYVDDVITGSDTIEDLISLRNELVELLKSGGFHLRKWTTNCWPLLISLPDEQRELSPVDFEESNSVKVLGLQWCPSADCFSYKVTLNISVSNTKRRILSEASRIFDPLGFLAPTIIAIKILLQELWRKQLKWDEEIPEGLSHHWMLIRQELHLFGSFSIPRLIISNKGNWELHGFCDASLDAYAGVVYCRSTNKDGSISVTLVAAKSKVAPLKVLSLPRLELCGAVLLTRLLNKIKLSFQEQDIKIYAWTDSSIVLHWLSYPPKKWSVFIGNRTSEILTSIPMKSWSHVRSASNPADAATRGMLPSTLANTNLWWKGPQWLSQERNKWPLSTPHSEDIDVNQLEERKVSTSQVFISHLTTPSIFEELLFKSSNWFRLVRIVAYVIRFFTNCRLTSKARKLESLTTGEVFKAKTLLFKCAQSTLFYNEIQLLKNHSELPTKHKLSSLTPFLDSFGVLRVGGRLEFSELTYTQKHPIVLCKSHNISKLIVEYEHRKHLHAGVSLLFSLLKQNYFILGGRNLTRKVVHDCVTCFRQKQTTTNQLMGNLPIERVRYSRPFNRVGCDYAGPIMVRLNLGRNPRFVKAYIALFVCFVTKALHLELVGDLSSVAFLQALDRFVARRGKPLEIWSDNGTNFHGAKRKLDEMHKLLCSQQHNNIITNHLSKDNIQWKFIPPSSPHFGGLWESGVRSVKLHLKRVIGDTKLTFEALYTLLTKIEALLNSRPLWHTSDSEPIALSPSHFLIGEAYATVPQPDIPIPFSSVSIKTNWSLLQAMMQGFWKRWHQEYLTSLQQRPKWRQSQPNFEVNDVVILKEPNLPPSKWILGRILKTHNGSDNKCRVVTIRTQFGEYMRPITKVVKLPNSERP